MNMQEALNDLQTVRENLTMELRSVPHRPPTAERLNAAHAQAVADAPAFIEMAAALADSYTRAQAFAEAERVLECAERLAMLAKAWRSTRARFPQGRPTEVTA